MYDKTKSFDKVYLFSPTFKYNISKIPSLGLSTRSLDMLIGSAYTTTCHNQQIAPAIGSSQSFSRGDATLAHSLHNLE
jgi:hypothetical protein